MRRFLRSAASTLALAAAAALLSTSGALAQVAGDVTLQLPSFSRTGVHTTVLVPDRGAASAATNRGGGASQSLYGGLPPQRGSGLTSSNSTSGITARIHDPAAAEADLQREVRERRATWSRGSVVARGRPQHVVTIRTGSVTSVADLERERAERAALRAQQLEEYLGEARQAARQGKSGVAAVYYGMAANRADGEEKLAIEAEARRVKAAAAERKQSPASRP